MTANPTELAALRAEWDRIQHYGSEMYMAATMGFVRRLLNELALATAPTAIPAAPSVSGVLQWLKARPGTSWIATVADIEAAVAGLSVDAASSAIPSPTALPALELYGEHLPDCVVLDGGSDCTCGFDATLERARSASSAIPSPTPERDFIAYVQEMSVSRANRWHGGDFKQWSGLEWAGAMCGEAGEAANVAKKLRRVELAIDGNAASERPLVPAELIAKLSSECADVFLYLVLLAARYDIDLTPAIVATFNKKSDEMGFPEHLQATPPAGAAPPTGPWKVENSCDQYWVDREGAPQGFVAIDMLTEAEAIAVRDALNRVASRVATGKGEG